MTLSEFNTCVDLYADGLYRFVLKNLRDEDKAKDIVQDTFEKTWGKIESIEYEKAKSYLFSAANNIMIDAIRKEKYKSKWDDDKTPEPYHVEQYNDVQQILSLALEKLPEVQKKTILLRDYEGYSYEEIGEILDLNESQVKVYIYRARKFLQEYIGSIETLI